MLQISLRTSHIMASDVIYPQFIRLYRLQVHCVACVSASQLGATTSLCACAIVPHVCMTVSHVPLCQMCDCVACAHVSNVWLYRRCAHVPLVWLRCHCTTSVTCQRCHRCYRCYRCHCVMCVTASYRSRFIIIFDYKLCESSASV